MPTLYATPNDFLVPITLASLASDTNLLAGRCSAVVDNTASRFDDVELEGFITTGTSPSNGTIIEVWAYGYVDATHYTGAVPGTDSAYTLTANDKLQLRLAAVIVVDATNNHQYDFGPVSIASLFGGVMPRKWGVFVDHSSGVVLNATAANHEINATGIFR